MTKIFDSVTIHEIQNKEPRRDWICNVDINGNAVSMKLGTGSQANIISVNQFKKLQQTQKGIKLHPAKESLKGYTGNALEIEGKCVLEVSHERAKQKALFHVCKGRSLLGRELCDKLDLVKFW